jgi:CheY-like chemotaxis protein
MKTVIAVGHCALDCGALCGFIEKAFAAKVVAAADWRELVAKAAPEQIALLLVNRVLDETEESGLELLAQLKREPAWSSVPVMLVSNYADAQAAAEQLGALPGFGKSDLRRSETLAKLATVLR